MGWLLFPTYLPEMNCPSCYSTSGPRVFVAAFADSPLPAPAAEQSSRSRAQKPPRPQCEGARTRGGRQHLGQEIDSELALAPLVRWGLPLTEVVPLQSSRGGYMTMPTSGSVLTTRLALIGVTRRRAFGQPCVRKPPWAERLPGDDSPRQGGPTTPVRQSPRWNLSSRPRRAVPAGRP
jgi:hypothetical protein